MTPLPTKPSAAFLTGSHAYGAPRPDSDIDLVVLVTPEVREKLETVLECQFGPMRAGKLNLICCDNAEQFDIWRRKTQALQEVAAAHGPVSRDVAKAFIRGELTSVGYADKFGMASTLPSESAADILERGGL